MNANGTQQTYITWKMFIQYTFQQTKKSKIAQNKLANNIIKSKV